LRKLLGFVLAVACIGCGRPPQGPSVSIQHSSAYTRLQEKYPVETKPVLVRKCFVGGTDITQPGEPVKVSRNRTIEISGCFAAGELGISGIAPMWTPREGEPQISLPHMTNSNDPKLFLVYMVHDGVDSQKSGAMLSGMVDNRQQENETEFRFRFTAPNRTGIYVVDIRLTGQQARGRDSTPTSQPRIIPLWRCELDVQ